MRIGESADAPCDQFAPWHRHHVEGAMSAYLSPSRELKKEKIISLFLPASPSTRMPLVNVLHNTHAFPLQNDLNIAAIGPGEELGSPEFWWKMFTSTILVLLGGVLSGCVSSRRNETRH
jgi:hypothetical protein